MVSTPVIHVSTWITAYLPIPRDGRLSWFGWLTHSGHYPRSGHTSITDQILIRESPPAKYWRPNHSATPPTCTLLPWKQSKILKPTLSNTLLPIMFAPLDYFLKIHSSKLQTEPDYLCILHKPRTKWKCGNGNKEVEQRLINYSVQNN